MAIGVDDAAAANARFIFQAADFFLFQKGRGIHVFSEILIDVEHVAVPFDSNVLDRILPFGVVVGIGSQIEGHSFFIQGDAGQGHVVFPADQASHAAPFRIDHGKVRFRYMGVGPDIAFGAGRFYLAVQGNQFSFRRENQIAAV